MNDQQRAFVREYAKDFNATQAALRAGYSPKSAYSQGQRLLKHAEVAAAIEAFNREAHTEGVLTASELQEWWSRTVRGEEPDARFADRQKASELLGKSLGVFTDRIEHSGGTRIEVIYVDAD
jgi:phage terminase small subunit